MSAGNFYGQVQSFYYYDVDGSHKNPIAPYQCVSLANAAEVAAANAAGVPGTLGDIVVRTPVNAGLATRRVVGITRNAAWSGTLVNVQVSGVAYVMTGAAVAFGPSTLLSPAVNEVRTSAQAPLRDNFDMLLPMDPRVVVSYQLCTVDDTAITASTTGANQLGYFVGYPLKGAPGPYAIIPVELDLGVKYY